MKLIWTQKLNELSQVESVPIYCKTIQFFVNKQNIPYRIPYRTVCVGSAEQSTCQSCWIMQQGCLPLYLSVSMSLRLSCVANMTNSILCVKIYQKWKWKWKYKWRFLDEWPTERTTDRPRDRTAFVLLQFEISFLVFRLLICPAW